MTLNINSQFVLQNLALSCVAALFFFIDLAIPLGVATGVPYVTVILLTLQLNKTSITFFWAIACTLLTLGGYYFSPEGGEVWKVVSNRLLAIYAIWSVAVISLMLLKKMKALGTLKSELQLSEFRSTLGEVAEYADDAVVITDKKGLITWVNSGFTKTSGYTLPEVIGKKPGDILQGRETNLDDIQRLSEAVKAEQSIHIEIINYHKNGTPYWIDLSINPIKENGQLVRFVAVQRDITERKQLELKLSSELEHVTHQSQAVTEAEPELEPEQNKRILVAEDNRVNAIVLTKFLRSMGFEDIDLAKNGAEAVDLAKQKKYHTILMDNHMPIMTGIEATSIIHQANPNTNIIACTADVSEEAKKDFFRSGAKGIIFKPINKQKLIDVLELTCIDAIPSVVGGN